MTTEQATEQGLTQRMHWLPFPGCFQCVVYDAQGIEVSSGMGSTKDKAREAALGGVS